MGISRRNPRGNFNWQKRILGQKAINCGQLNDNVDCDLFGPTLQIIGNNICKPSVSPTNQTVSVANTQPGQASTTSYEWYEGGPGGPLYYSSYGGSDSSIEFTVAQQVLGTTTFWIVVTNSLGCVTSQYLDIYVSNQPDVSITTSDPTDPCVADPGNPFGQSSNGIISVTVNNPDPNALYYGYVIRNSANVQYETTDPSPSFSWTDLCFDSYTITVKLYRLIDGTPTVMCTYTDTVVLGALILTWDSIAYVPVADPNDVSLWNAWLGIPASFTDVDVIGDVVYLRNPASPCIIGFSWSGNTHIVSIEDQPGFVIFVDNYSMQNCTSLVSVILPDIDFIGIYAFVGCSALQEVISSAKGCKEIGDNAFAGCSSLTTLTFPAINDSNPSAPAIGTTQGDNLVFKDVTGSTIIVTVPVFFQTSNAGGLEGDLAYLDTNNTVTFNWV